MIAAGLVSGAAFVALFPRILPPDDYHVVVPLPDSLFPWWALAVALGFGATLAIAVHAYATTPAGPARRRLRPYVGAFAVLDVTFVANYAVFSAYVAGLPVDLILFDVNAWTYPAGVLVFALVLTHSILKRQFLVASELVERLLGVQGELFGIAAAVAVGLVFRRVEGLAGRVADRLMPGVEDTDAYRRVRRHDVYRATVESALQDGEITERERAVLATLAEQMALSTREAQRIEQDVVAAMPS
jgi:hypothetical protein